MRFPRLRLLAAILVLPAALAALTIDELAQQPEHWPVEVTVTAMTKAAVIRNGQPAGMMLIGAGRVLTVSGIAADGLTGKFGSTTVKVPFKQTDLLKRLEAASISIEEPDPAGDDPAPDPAPPPPKAPPTKPAKPAAVAPAPAKETPVAPAPAAKVDITPIQRALVGRLVHLEKGDLKGFDARQLNGVKYYAVLFSAGWCGPCRQFAPVLLEQYRKLKQAHPEFELVFYSWDHSGGDMKDYMRGENMPWPALKFDDRESIAPIARLAGPGIPCLVLIDATGKVLAHSFDGDNYLGPGVALDKAWQVMGPGHGK